MKTEIRSPLKWTRTLLPPQKLRDFGGHDEGWQRFLIKHNHYEGSVQVLKGGWLDVTWFPRREKINSYGFHLKVGDRCKVNLAPGVSARARVINEHAKAIQIMHETGIQSMEWVPRHSNRLGALD